MFLAGCVFLLMTVLKLRQWLVGAIPKTLRYSFAVGIGLFLTFIGLNDSGIVALGVAGAPGEARESGVTAGAAGDPGICADYDLDYPPISGSDSRGDSRGDSAVDGVARRAASAWIR